MEATPKRIEWIDCVKAIGLLLMIFAHSLLNNVPIPHALLIFSIYSFHMPLFFVASGLTMKFSSCKEQFLTATKKSFFKLFIPMVVAYLTFELTRHFSGIGFHVPFFFIFMGLATEEKN